MIVMLMSLFVFIPLNTISEIHHPAKTGFCQKPESSGNCRIADIFVLFPCNIKQLLSAEMPFCSQKDTYNFVSLFGLSQTFF